MTRWLNTVLVYVAAASVVAASVLGFLWWNAREALSEAREQIVVLEKTREADNRAFERLQAERNAIQRRYDELNRELSEITDAPSVDYLNAPVPDSVRRLLER